MNGSEFQEIWGKFSEMNAELTHLRDRIEELEANAASQRISEMKVAFKADEQVLFGSEDEQ